jgi:hypothetical protein
VSLEWKVIFNGLMNKEIFIAISNLFVNKF